MKSGSSKKKDEKEKFVYAKNQRKLRQWKHGQKHIFICTAVLSFAVFR